MIPYLIKSFRGGISDENSKGVEGSFKHGYGLDIHKRQDSLSCGKSMSTVLDATTGVMGSDTGTTMTGIINFFIPARDGSTYCFGSTGSIFARNDEGVFTFVFNDEGGNINGAGEWQQDDGTNYLFWATASAIARKTLPGSNSAPDTGTMRWTDAVENYKTEFISSTAVWHTMQQAAGSLYIANNESLSEVDFAGNFNPQVMNIRPGNMINCLEERDDYIYIGSARMDQAEEGHIWNWTPIADNFVQKNKIPVKGVNALIHTEIDILQGGTNGELFFADFQSPVPLNALNGGGTVNPGGSTIENDIAKFGFFGGTYPGIWSYGRSRKNRPFALNYDYRLAKTVGGSTISTIGAIALVNGKMLVSWGTTDESTSEYGIDQVNTTTLATAVYEALEFSGGSPHEKKHFSSVKVTTSPLPASTSYSIKFKLDKETDWRYAVLGDNTTTFSQSTETESEWFIGKPGRIYEVGAELNPSGTSTPEILSITTYIDNNMYAH